MPYRIKKRQLKSLIKEAVFASKDGGKEICGVIIDTGYFLELTKAKNKIKKVVVLPFILKKLIILKKLYQY